MRTAFVLPFVATLAAGVASAEPRTGEFRDWAVGCDNGRVCRAIGFPSEGSGEGALLVERGAAPDSQPRVWFSFGHLEETEVPRGAAIEISADGRSLGRAVVGAGLIARENDDRSFDVRDDALRARILDALRGASRLRLAATRGSLSLDISLEGASAALLFIDERQHRVGTVTALVRRGERPASSVPKAPSVEGEPPNSADPSWRPAPSALPAALLQQIRPAGDDCSATVGNEPLEASALGRLTADLVLVQVLCGRGAYNFEYRLHLWNERTGDVRAVTLPAPEGFQAEVSGEDVTNPDFDPDTLTLSSFAKARGIGDCGSIARWRWDGSTFRLTHYDYMPRCHGLVGTGWLTLHRSR